VARAGKKDDLGIMLPDEPVEVDVHEAEAGGGTPVTQEARLDVLGPKRLV
jgi:hypothetical protein